MNDQTLTLPLGHIETALSAVAGETVELISRSLGESSLWFVAPVDRGRLSSRFWKEVQASDGRGMWNTPGEALAGFCEGAKAWVAAAGREAPEAAAGLLRERMAMGPSPATRLYAEAAAVGISKGQLDRAARKMGVVRRKASLREGWVWSLESEGVSEDFEAALGM